MTVKNGIKYLNKFTDYEKTTGYSYNAAYFNLARMRYLLFKLGNPHLKIPSIHITGTKGKGSVANMLSSMLTESGLKTGLYTSPHILTFRERIRINGRMISLKEISKLTDKLKSAVDDLLKYTKYGTPTYFEVYTVLAFLYFYMKKTDVMVLEVGMGGRLDATNVVFPLVSIITPISLDHTKELGNTIKKIAKEKAGIIKRNSIIISAPQQKSVAGLIKKISKEKNSKYIQINKDLRFKIKNSNINGTQFDYYGIKHKLKDIKLNIIGQHQVQNAAIAISALETVASALGIERKLSKAVKAGLAKVKMTGRIEVIGKNPAILLDVAHNVASAKVLVGAIRKYFRYKKLILVLGMSSNKDIKGVSKELSKIADLAILTKSSNYRSAGVKEMLKKSNFKRTICRNTVSNSIEYAKKIAGKEDLICITGSFYMIHDALKYIADSGLRIAD